MKKILLSILTCISLAGTASAQLAEGSVFPDFTFTDIHGHVQHLYAYLDAGKTVFIDISATWCPPCWNYHIGHHLDSLYAQHGPAGDSGVNATTTNDVQVLFVQGEPTSGMAELTYNHIGTGAILFTTTELPYSQVTQGDWTAGTYYPIIDDSTGQSTYNTAWNITYFPTIYMICRDHLVHVMSQPTAVEAYAAAQGTCPTTAPATGTNIDAKAIPSTTSAYYICSANPTVAFQNYSTTANITSATLNVKDATGAIVGTATYSGTLAPYATASITIPTFAGTSFGGYKYSVTVAGDINTANNNSADSVFKVYAASNANSLPASENFDGATISYKDNFSSDGYVFPVNGSALTGYLDASGGHSNAMIFDFYQEASGGISEFVFGNFNTSASGTYKLSFDHAAAQYNSSTTDALAVQISTDCGATWTSVWTKSGATLATSSVDTNTYIPSAASQWMHDTVNISTYRNANTVIKFVGTSNYGNNAWVDNIYLVNSTAGVQNINALANEITLAPNPASEMTNINISLNEDAQVQVVVIDVTGRVVTSMNQSLNAGENKIELATGSYVSGVYTVKVIAGNTTSTQKLTVVK